MLFGKSAETNDVCGAKYIYLYIYQISKSNNNSFSSFCCKELRSFRKVKRYCWIGWGMRKYLFLKWWRIFKQLLEFKNFIF